MKKLRLWRQKIPDRLVIRMLAVLCVLLLGVSGLLLWQRNTAREGEKLRGEADYRFIAVEPASCPSLTRGK